MVRSLLLIVVAVMVLFFLSGSVADAYYADINPEKRSVALGVSGQDETQTLSVTIMEPAESINGLFAMYVGRQSKGVDIVSEVFNGRVEAGIPVSGWQFQVYGDATRDYLRAIRLHLEGGYFVETPVYQRYGFDWSAGIGNFSANRSIDKEIGRKETDASTTFGVLSFLSAKRCDVLGGDLAGVVRFKPNVNTAEWFVNIQPSAETSLSYTQRVSDTIGLAFTTLGIFDPASATDRKFSSNYLFQLTYVPQ